MFLTEQVVHSHGANLLGLLEGGLFPPPRPPQSPKSKVGILRSSCSLVTISLFSIYEFLQFRYSLSKYITKTANPARTIGIGSCLETTESLEIRCGLRSALHRCPAWGGHKTA